MHFDSILWGGLGARINISKPKAPFSGIARFFAFRFDNEMVATVELAHSARHVSQYLCIVPSEATCEFL